MAPYEKESSHSSSDFETSLSEDVPQDEIPPAVIEAEDDKTTSSGMSTMVNMQNPADVVGADQTLHVAPLSMVPMRHQEAPTPLRGQEAPIPAWLKGHDFYVDGDWKAFHTTRSNGHKDWTYTHREYCTKFRSKPEVELFLNSKGTTNGLFKGRKLRRKVQVNLPEEERLPTIPEETRF
ncbi:uncharacterized protein LOC133903247 [Phragmites australis]|uniref:uncharacterized protein LOC133903247 n=1 Tax=Phragmites australis TaxID=29695 RepID=UPI002D77F9B3|nr:uncharacterized protein LOC133903247 [Phragmites australis]